MDACSLRQDQQRGRARWWRSRLRSGTGGSEQGRYILRHSAVGRLTGARISHESGPGAKVFIAAVRQPDGTLQGRGWRVAGAGVPPALCSRQEHEAWSEQLLVVPPALARPPRRRDRISDSSTSKKAAQWRADDGASGTVPKRCPSWVNWP